MSLDYPIRTDWLKRRYTPRKLKLGNVFFVNGTFVRLRGTPKNPAPEDKRLEWYRKQCNGNRRDKLRTPENLKEAA